jgi:hypothetical protein
MNSGLFDQDIALTEFQFPAEGRTCEVSTTEDSQFLNAEFAEERGGNKQKLLTSGAPEFKLPQITLHHSLCVLRDLCGETTTTVDAHEPTSDDRMCMRVTVCRGLVKHISLSPRR